MSFNYPILNSEEDWKKENWEFVDANIEDLNSEEDWK